MKELGKDEIIALFPLKAQITNEIITNAKRASITNCTGALTLKSILNIPNKVIWGIDMGYIFYAPRKRIAVTPVEHVDMIQVREPIEVTFVVDKIWDIPDSLTN